MVFVKTIHLVIKYKKGNTYKLTNILSRPPTLNITALGSPMHMELSTHYAYREEYSNDEDFTEVL